MLRIGILTSGGDCQALNATMRGVVKGLANSAEDLEVYGFMNGYKGLIYGDYRMLTAKDFSGILTRGGTILGTSRQPFKLMRVPDENGLDKVEAMKQLIAKQPGVLALDDLKTRLSGNRAHVDVNIVVNGNLRVWQGHAIAHGTRLAIEAAFPEVKACMIHVNPDKEYAPEDEAVPHSANRQN